ncbi:MAG: UDP-glucose/GDP-mannose dehydrogenase family protein [Pseudomonadota bacterium]
MKIAIIGTGYVGLVTGTCLSELGHHVIAFDHDQAKIAALKKGQVPIYEPGLNGMIHRMVEAKRLYFSTDIEAYIHEVSATIVAVGTPSKCDGSADLSYVEVAIKRIAPLVREGSIIINKSTVPVGTAFKTSQWINDCLKAKGKKQGTVHAVSNPEFLREGAAVEDFLNPDRVIIGVSSDEAFKIARDIYAPFAAKGVPIIKTNTQTAELIKYAANAYLATRLSFINEMSDLCEKTEADIRTLSTAIGLDKRIGPHFLRPGPGYGGSCFPKDTRALLDTAKQYKQDMSIVRSSVESNDLRKANLLERVKQKWGALSGLRISLFGLTFKADTDDVRETPSFDMIKNLHHENVEMSVFDPQGADNFKIMLKNFKFESPLLHYSKDMSECLKGSDGLIILTEWAQFSTLLPEDVKTHMRHARIFDFRNILDEKIFLEAGIEYQGIGY